MNDRFKFRIAVYERQQNNMPWEFVEYIDPDNQHWGLNQCGDIISDSFYSAHYTRKNAPDSVHRVYEAEQCTGLKDKNGNLIYENDIVLGNSGFKYCIIWSEMELGWALQNLETRLCIAINAFMPDELEIIGNVHTRSEE